MSERSVAPPARTTIPLEALAEKVEAEIARLAESRPHFSDRIGRAATILVVHLSNPRSGTIRCRVRRGGRTVLLVRSLSAGGVTYEVDPAGWGCSCPDYHRRDAACKHVLACWVLRSAGGGVGRRPCDGCGLRFKPRDLVELNEDNHDNLSRFHGDMLCRECADAAGVMR